MPITYYELQFVCYENSPKLNDFDFLACAIFRQREKLTKGVCEQYQKDHKNMTKTTKAKTYILMNHT